MSDSNEHAKAILTGLVESVRAAYPRLSYEEKTSAKAATKRADGWIKSSFFNAGSSEQARHVEVMRSFIKEGGAQ